MSVVLECPVCDSAFQVLPENAGQLVACPNCNEAVSVPDDLGAVQSAPIPMAKPAPPAIFNCGNCSGKFGVTPDMNGSHVACPHCQEHVLVQIDLPSAPAPPLIETKAPSVGPVIPKIRTGRKKKKKIIRIAEPTPPTPPTGVPADRTDVSPPNSSEGSPQPKKREAAKETKKTSNKKQIERTFDDAENVPRESDMLPPVKKKQSRKEKPSSKSQPEKRGKQEPKSSAAQKTPKKKTPKTGSKNASGKTKSKSVAALARVPSESRQSSKKKTGEKRAEKKGSTKPIIPAQSDGAGSSSPPGRNNTESENSSVTSTDPPSAAEQVEAHFAKPSVNVALIERRLPPRFTVEDPEEDAAIRSDVPTAKEHEVILPDGEGGYTRVDSRVVHVERDGEILQLKAPTKESRAFNRMVQNVFSIGLGILILVLAFWILIYW